LVKENSTIFIGCSSFSDWLPESYFDGETAQKPVSHALYTAAFACGLASIVFVAIEKKKNLKKNLWQTSVGITGGVCLAAAVLIDFHRGWFALVGMMLLLALGMIRLAPPVLRYMRDSYREIENRG